MKLFTHFRRFSSTEKRGEHNQPPITRTSYEERTETHRDSRTKKSSNLLTPFPKIKLQFSRLEEKTRISSAFIDNARTGTYKSLNSNNVRYIREQSKIQRCNNRGIRGIVARLARSHPSSSFTLPTLVKPRFSFSFFLSVSSFLSFLFFFFLRERIFYSAALDRLTALGSRGRLISQSHCIKPEACIKQRTRRFLQARRLRERQDSPPREQGRKELGGKKFIWRRIKRHGEASARRVAGGCVAIDVSDDSRASFIFFSSLWHILDVCLSLDCDLSL